MVGSKRTNLAGSLALAGAVALFVAIACTDQVPDSSQFVFKQQLPEPNTIDCNDGNPCTTGEKYDETGECKGGKPVLCPADSANKCSKPVCVADGTQDVGYACVPSPVTPPPACDDGDICTTGDTCLGIACQGTPTVCDDNSPCTSDDCVSKVGCKHTNLPDGSLCDDGNSCTVGDQCSGGQCQSGTSSGCDDGNPCTDDQCDKLLGCTHTNNTVGCDDTDPCTGPDICKFGGCSGPKVDCLEDNNPCTDDGCPVTAGAGCSHVAHVGACDDHDACTSDEACVGTVCQGGSDVICDDGNVCTADSCDKNVGCFHTTATLACDDGNTCTVGDQCLDGFCNGGAALPCDDGEPCTDDGCDGMATSLLTACNHTANTAPCDDKNDCTVGDTCAGKKCQPGSPNVQTFDVGGPKEDKLSGIFRSSPTAVTFIGSRDAGVQVAMAVDVSQLSGLQTMPVVAAFAGAACGDGTCAAAGGESVANCPVDCAANVCGNATCETGETSGNCPTDCTTVGCGDGVCAVGENAGNCLADCPANVGLPSFTTATDDGTIWEYATGVFEPTYVIGRRDAKSGGTAFNATWAASLPPPFQVETVLSVLPDAVGGAALLVAGAGQLPCGASTTTFRYFVVQLNAALTVQSVTAIGSDMCTSWNPVVSSPSAPNALLVATDFKGPDGVEHYQLWSIALGASPTATVAEYGAVTAGADPSGTLLTGDQLPTAVAWSGAANRWIAWHFSLEALAARVLTPDLTLDRAVFNANPSGDSFSVGMVADGQGGFAALTSQYYESAPEFLRFDAWGNLVQALQLGGADYVQPVSLLRDGAKWLIGGNIKLAGKKGQWWVGYVDDFGHGSCATSGACAGKLFVSCEDGNPCTSVDCDAQTGKCAAPTDAAPCLDPAGLGFWGDPLNCAVTGCDASLGCVIAVPLCTDDNACTTDSCAGEYPSCTHVVTSCDDKNPCTADSCDTTTGACLHSNLTGACDDGDACTTNTTCFGGQCQNGDPVACAFGETCNSMTGCSFCAAFGELAPTCAADVCQAGYWLPKCHAALSAGPNHTCLIQPDGSLWCWGMDDAGQIEAPLAQGDTFLRVCGGSDFSCAVRASGTISCWGGAASWVPPAGKFADIACGPNYACALGANGVPSCWGAPGMSASVLSPPNTAFKRISAGADVACGVKNTGTLACWGTTSDAVASPPAGNYVDIGVSSAGYACAIDTDGKLHCWGSDAYGMVSAAPSAGPYFAIATGGGMYKGADRGFACALPTVGKPQCWSGQSGPEFFDLPDDTTVTAVTAGAAHACGITSLGLPVCWGGNHDNVTMVLYSTVKQFVCGSRTCDSGTTLESPTNCPIDCGGADAWPCGDNSCELNDGGANWCEYDCDWNPGNPCDTVVACNVWSEPFGYGLPTWTGCFCDAACMTRGDCCQTDGSRGTKCAGSSCAACNP